MKQKISKCFFDARVRMLLLLLISTIYAQAQSGRIVTGVVKDATGETVIGVNVTVKGNAALGTITDLDGKYSLNVPAQKSTLVFSFIGYQTVEKTIDANVRTLNVTLVEDSKLLDEVVVVGYGTMKRKDVTPLCKNPDYNPKEWNSYIIRCEGPRIRIWLNGEQTLDYIEPFSDCPHPDAQIGKIPLTGYIALQIHEGKACEAIYKDIEIEKIK